MKARIYHNPRCSKSRATLALLESRGIEPEVIEYLKHPPSPEVLTQLLVKLGLPARELVRTGEPEFESAAVDIGTADDAELVALMSAHPRLIQRPIVEVGDDARIGRPPEKVLELLE